MPSRGFTKLLFHILLWCLKWASKEVGHPCSPHPPAQYHRMICYIQNAYTRIYICIYIKSLLWLYYIIYGFFYTARDYRISSAQFHHGSMLLLTVMVMRRPKKKWTRVFATSWGVEEGVRGRQRWWWGRSRGVGGVTTRMNFTVSLLYRNNKLTSGKWVQFCFFRVVKAVGGACHSGA